MSTAYIDVVKLRSETAHLSPDHMGFMMQLVCHIFERGGSIPQNADFICRMTGATKAQYRRLWPDLQEFFTVEAVENSKKVIKLSDQTKEFICDRRPSNV